VNEQHATYSEKRNVQLQRMALELSLIEANLRRMTDLLAQLVDLAESRLRP
jgi:hypothetical protein